MKALICEMCGSNDMIKQDGLYVCQSCRTKYTVEEARKMLTEIDGTVDVSGSTVKIDNSESVQNYLEIGENALKAGNGGQAEVYANKALEVAPNNSRAWLLKMRSYEHTATFGNSQTPDILAAGLNVIEYAEDREKAEADTYEYYLQRALSLLVLATVKLKDKQELHSNSLNLGGANAIKIDNPLVEMYSKMADSAVDLANAIPAEALGKYDKLPGLSKTVATAYGAFQQALISRLYGIIESYAMPSWEKKVHDITDPAKKNLDERAKQAIAQYQAANQQKLQEKKSNLEQQIQELTGQLDKTPEYRKLLEATENKNKLEIKQLGAFTQKKKDALQKQITELNAEIGKYKAVTDPIITSLEKAKADFAELKDLFDI